MRSYAVVFLSLFSCVFSVSVNKLTYEIVADSKEPIPAILVPCGLSDILVFSSPVVRYNVTVFRLTKPNGDSRYLHLSLTSDSLKPRDRENYVKVKYDRKKRKVIRKLNNYRVFNVNHNGLGSDEWNYVFEEHEDAMGPNDFMIGPVGEDDHGNWVLSLFAEVEGKLVEFFQIISVEITEYVFPKDHRKTLYKGDTFTFGFAYPIPRLESCEFTAPDTTFDRWYDRDQDNLDSCMFVVKNVTKADEGIWTLLGVGKILYRTEYSLNVR